MKYHFFPLLIALSLILVAGCGNPASEAAHGNNSVQSREELHAPELLPFDITSKRAAKASIYYGSDELIAELTDAAKLNELAAILDRSPSFSGDAPADLNNTIILESQDGTKHELVVTGNGQVFIDQTANLAYALDKEKFAAFIKSFHNTIGNPTARDMLMDDAQADIFQWNGIIYRNASAIEWVQEADLTAGERIGTISKSYKAGQAFEDQMATRLPVGTEVFEAVKKAGPILIVHVNENEMRYLGLIEG